MLAVSSRVSSLDNEHHGDADIEETQDFPLDSEHLGGVDIGESRTEPLRGSFSGKIKLIGRGNVRTDDSTMKIRRRSSYETIRYPTKQQYI